MITGGILTMGLIVMSIIGIYGIIMFVDKVISENVDARLVEENLNIDISAALGVRTDVTADQLGRDINAARARHGMTPL